MRDDLLVINMDERFREIYDYRDSVPFGESEFARQQYVLNRGHDVDDFRQCVLQAWNKMNDVQFNNFKLGLNKIDIDQIRFKIKWLKRLVAIGFFFLKWKVQRLEISLTDKVWGEKNMAHLFQNAWDQLGVDYETLKALPEINKKEYEAAQPENRKMDAMKNIRLEAIASRLGVSKGAVMQLEKNNVVPERVMIKPNPKTGMLEVIERTMAQIESEALNGSKNLLPGEA